MAPSYPGEAEVTAALRAMGCRADRVSAWAPHLAAACQRHAINKPARVALFLANGAHETGLLSSLVESLNYTPARLIAVFGARRITPQEAGMLGRLEGAAGRVIRPADQKGIACIVYGGEWGFRNLGNLIGSDDGWVFRGAGFMQLTGRASFTRFGKMIGKKPEELPALLATIPGAAESAAFFFETAGCNGLADLGEVEACRKKINGGTIGLAEVRRHYADALAALSPKGP